jgi:hypothetical protein
MIKVSFLFSTAFAFLLLISQAGCNRAGQPQSSAADTLAKITKIQLIRQEGFPVQISVKVEGVLPDTCTTFRNIEQRKKDEDNVFHINLITNPHPGTRCSGSEAPFDVEVPLQLDGLPKGKYRVNVNGKEEKFELEQDNSIE